MDHKFISAKQFIEARKSDRFIYENSWKESTTAILHAPRQIDKTALAFKIASTVAVAGSKILYVNIDDRLDTYINADMPENFYVFTPEYESPDDATDYAELVFEAIEQAIRSADIRVFIIDSISKIAALSFGRNSSPAYIMKRIAALQIRFKVSVLVVAHDTTKAATNSLLALAASEICIEKDITSDSQEHVENTPSSPDLIPSVILTRRQQRRLRRSAAKHPERYAAATAPPSTAI